MWCLSSLQQNLKTIIYSLINIRFKTLKNNKRVLLEFLQILSESFIVAMSEKELCARDLSILDLLFDPNQFEKDSTQPIKDDIEAKDQEEGNSDEIVKSKALEVEGVQLTETGNLEEALKKFNESIDISNQRPSTFNNRAQLYRFMKKDDCKSDLHSIIKYSLNLSTSSGSRRSYKVNWVIRRNISTYQVQGTLSTWNH